MNDGILGNRDVTSVDVWTQEFWSVPDSMMMIISIMMQLGSLQSFGEVVCSATSQECKTALTSQFWSVMGSIRGSVMVAVMESVWGHMVGQDSERRPWSHLNCQKSPSLSKRRRYSAVSTKVKSCQGSLKANEEFTRSSGFHSWWWCSMMLMLILGDHFNFDIASSEVLVWSSMHFLPILTTLATKNVLLYQETKSAYIESFPKMNDRVRNENGFDIHKVQHIISSKTGEKLCRNVEKWKWNKLAFS